MKRLFHAAALAALVSLAACGGGGADRQPLSIEDDAPHAYTLAYLKDHPEVIVQPEHQLIVPIDPDGPNGGFERVDVYVREPMTLSLALAPGQQALARVSVEDDRGTERLRHEPGQDVATATLQTGVHRIVFRPNGRADGGRAHVLYLKLADTPAQMQRRQQTLESRGGALAAGRRAALDLRSATTPLGQVEVDNCNVCSFDNSDLSNQNLSGSRFLLASFDKVKLYRTNFSDAVCMICKFTNITMFDSGPGSTTFRDTDLSDAVFAAVGTGVWGMNFNGAKLWGATLSGNFVRCDFGPSPVTGASTDLTYSDLSAAYLAMWDTNTMLQKADLSFAKVASTTFIMQLQSNIGLIKMFVGAKLDNITPAGVFTGSYFHGHDLSGVSLAGMDLSTTDLSAGNAVVLTAMTDLSQATLTNGTSGVNLAGQNALFSSSIAPFTAWGGTVADSGSGKDLRFVNLSGVDLSKADLTRARLDGANLVGTVLSYANLYGVSLRGALLGIAPGTGTQAAATLDNAYMPLADLSDADLRSVNFSSVHLYTLDGHNGVTFARARLDAANFSGAFLMGADFSQASLNDTNFNLATMFNTTFSGAQMANAKLTKASLQGADFSGISGQIGIDLSNATVSMASGSLPFTDFDQIPRTYGFGATVLGPLLTGGGVICPNGTPGPCSGPDSLNAAEPAPYPPAPVCVGLKIYHYQNCDPGWQPPTN